MSWRRRGSSRSLPSVDPLDAFGFNVLAAREAAGLTQDQAADAAGMDVGQYRRIEAGKTNASVRTVARIAGALQVSDASVLLRGVAGDANQRSRSR